MKMSNLGKASIGFLLLVVLTILGIGIVQYVNADTASTTPAVMNVSVNVTVGILLSGNLSTGIFYTNYTGSVNNKQYQVNANSNNNATWNYIGGGNGGTAYWVNNTGSTYETICSKADEDLICYPGTPCGSARILLGNATWNNGTTPTGPGNFPGPNIWTTAYTTMNGTAYNLNWEVPNNGVYTRYWLTVPAGIPGGVYNTTYRFCAVEAGTACSC